MREAVEAVRDEDVARGAEEGGTPGRRYRYLDILTTIFVVILLVSNLVAQKVCAFGPVFGVGPFYTSGAMLLFPATYIFGDIFTEVYGFASSRRAIWLGFFGTALLYGLSAAVIALPGAPGWKNQGAFATVFGFIPRLVVASLVAYWMGEFTNSDVMAKMKVMTQGRWLWTRTVGSTVTGQAVDTVIVVLIAFWGQAPGRTLVALILSAYFGKVAYEILATPLTYAVVGWLKRTEQVDAFDENASFNPFAVTSY